MDLAKIKAACEDVALDAIYALTEMVSPCVLLKEAQKPRPTFWMEANFWDGDLDSKAFEWAAREATKAMAVSMKKSLVRSVVDMEVVELEVPLVELLCRVAKTLSGHYGPATHGLSVAVWAAQSDGRVRWSISVAGEP